MFDFPNSPSVGQVYAPAGGPSWTWDGTVWKSFQQQAEMQIARTFIPGASGAATNYVYSKPSNLRHLEFEGVAAGGSAGPAIATGASVWSFSSGGGGGAWGKKLFTAAALPASVTITIGAPGQGVSSGNGQDAAATTFGALITLPGGLKGLQGANTAYTSTGYVSGSQVTNDPTGVDVGMRGESSDGCVVALSGGGGSGVTSYVGKAGGSPWGRSYPAYFGSGGGAVVGYGYGSGSMAPLNSGSSALKSSVAGAPGAVLLTEYLVTAAGPDYVTASEQNLIINGGVQISQEWISNTLYTAAGVYFADQWYASYSGPTGGTHLNHAAYLPGDAGLNPGQLQLRSLATTFAAPTAAQYYGCATMIEGSNAAVLGWGTAAAIPAVLSFEFYSTVAGTFAVAIRNGVPDLAIAFPITIAAGEINTWKRFAFAVPAITSGTFAKNNARGLDLWFTAMCGTSFQAPTAGVWASGNYIGLAGQSNLLATATQSFSIRRIGLYADPGGTGIAPPFEMPDLQSELTKCQRYFQKLFNWWCGQTVTGNAYYTYPQLPVPMRAVPTVGSVHHSAGNFPAAVGTVTPVLIAGQISTVAIQEARTANVTGNASYFATIFSASARM